jgi:DNA gyrase inhibitor GyrI
VIRQLSPPWEDVFTTIESLNGKDIAVLSLEPEPVSAQVRVGAEARTTEAMLEYLERLRNSARLSPAVLQTHQVMTEDPHRPIRFTFTASWISAKSAQN